MAAIALETSSPASTTTVSLETTILPLSILAGTPTCCNSPRKGPGGNPVSPAGITISSGAIELFAYEIRKRESDKGQS